MSSSSKRARGRRRRSSTAIRMSSTTAWKSRSQDAAGSMRTTIGACVRSITTAMHARPSRRLPPSSWPRRIRRRRIRRANSRRWTMCRSIRHIRGFLCRGLLSTRSPSGNEAGRSPRSCTCFTRPTSLVTIPTVSRRPAITTGRCVPSTLHASPSAAGRRTCHSRSNRLSPSPRSATASHTAAVPSSTAPTAQSTIGKRTRHFPSRTSATRAIPSRRWKRVSSATCCRSARKFSSSWAA